MGRLSTKKVIHMRYRPLGNSDFDRLQRCNGVQEQPSLERLLSRLTELCVETEGIVPRNTEAETSSIYSLIYNNTLSGIV